MGLKVGTVKLESYNKDWIVEFEKERDKIIENFRNIAIKIEHIGSTSIPGLISKPIIDIAVAVKSLSDFEKIRKQYENNRIYNLKEEKDSGEILIRKGTEDNITHFIHVMEYDSERYKNTILFRNYLRKNKNIAEEYEKIKEQLAEKYKDNRKMYTASKNEFIQSVIKEAKV